MIPEPRITWISADKSNTKKRGPSRPACPPLHQPSVFPGYLIYIFNTQRSPEKIKKKFLEQALGLFQNQERSTSFGLYRDRSPNVAATDLLSLFSDTC
jgi:hypothetical protein